MTKEDEEYEKDLNELKEQIFKEGNTLISKKDLLERFVEIDNEYKNSHWNLLQILANIDTLIGKEPCEDAVRRKAVIDTLDEMDKVLNEDRTVERYIDLLKECYTVLPSVNPQEPVLDKIRSEIMSKDGLEEALEIIDKYRTESEE